MDTPGISAIAEAAARYEAAMSASLAANEHHAALADAYTSAWEGTEDADEDTQIEVDALRYYAESAHTIAVEAAEHAAAAQTALEGVIAEHLDAAQALVTQLARWAASRTMIGAIIDDMVNTALAIREGSL